MKDDNNTSLRRSNGGQTKAARLILTNFLKPGLRVELLQLGAAAQLEPK
jgi:hypothetical protein